LVHSPAAEQTFMDAGSGVDRQLVMHNTFLIVGPTDDPAGIRGMTSAADALGKIAETGSTFVSRGDGSGTEAKELGYWKKLGITPDPAWYVQSGQGMGATLQIASEKGGYTLTDIATWAATRDQLSLESMVDNGDPSLLNIYHVIGVNPATWPLVNAAGATAFSDYILSPDGQALIGAFGQDTMGMQLFVPDAGKSEDNLTTP
ncbi:MAG: substrate-binding domain-containing protein, partial [Chloroflexi bacterium]|nr:substrate-binding domain-containing protein [Chloroflexota bacterium]